MKSTHKKISIIIGIILGAAAIAVLTVILIPAAKVPLHTVQVNRMDIIHAVTANGQVAGDENVDLAFDTSGTVAHINVAVGDIVKKGDILGSLSSDIMTANLESAQANVIANQAQLAQLELGNRPEAVAVYQQKVNDAGTAFATAMHDAYLKVQSAINNNSDVLFTNPQSPNPQINVLTANQATKDSINNERLTLGEKLAVWGTIAGNDITPQTQATASDTLNYAKNFLIDLAAITTNLSVGNSGLSQAQISADNAVVNAAASIVNAGLGEYVAAQSGYNEANNALTLEAAGGTTQDVQTQTAKVAAAQAQADLIQSQINHTTIRAPFDGIISAVNLKVGEVTVPGFGQPAFSIISPGLKTEVQVPENDISKITASDTASITLDAYGSGVIFPAQVSLIDPSETVVNGVNSYKVTLEFTTNDPRIRSGMTANASIITDQVTQAIAIPSQSILSDKRQTDAPQPFVLIEKTPGVFTEQPVTTGIIGSNGYTAITGGLNEGDVIASFGIPKSN